MSSRSRSSRTRLSRRSFLRGVGGITVSLPWLEKLHGVAHAQSIAPTPRRMIVMTYQMGVPLEAWRPTGGATGFSLPTVTSPLNDFRDRCLFVSGLDNRVLEVGGDSFTFGHPAKTEAALTGTLTTGAFNATNRNQVSDIRSDRTTDGAANGPSIEHIVGQHLLNRHAFSSVDLGVDGDAIYGSTVQTFDSRFHFESAGNPICLTMHPNRAFDRIFAGVVTTPGEGPSAEELAMRDLRLRNKSVLDAVRESFNELKQGLGSQDRRRLEEHASRIRQLEIDLRVSAQCTVPDDPGSAYAGQSMAQIAPLQNRILARALGCDLAPVGRIEYVNQQNPRFGVAELDQTLDDAGAAGVYDWHAMVHGDPLPGTQVPMRPGIADGYNDYDPRLLSGYRFFVEQFANLLTELDAIPEGPDGSVLDNTLAVLATDLGEGLGHGNRKMGYVLAGNLGGARTGYHYNAAPGNSSNLGSYFYTRSRADVTQLLHSIVDMAGVDDGAGNPIEVGLGGYRQWVQSQDGSLPPRRIEALFG